MKRALSNPEDWVPRYIRKYFVYLRTDMEQAGLSYRTGWSVHDRSKDKGCHVRPRCGVLPP